MLQFLGLWSSHVESGGGVSISCQFLRVNLRSSSDGWGIIPFFPCWTYSISDSLAMSKSPITCHSTFINHRAGLEVLIPSTGFVNRQTSWGSYCLDRSDKPRCPRFFITTGLSQITGYRVCPLASSHRGFGVISCNPTDPQALWLRLNVEYW